MFHILLATVPDSDGCFFCIQHFRDFAGIGSAHFSSDFQANAQWTRSNRWVNALPLLLLACLGFLMTMVEKDPEVGERIKRRRRSLGISQDALAAASGYTPSQISKIERGVHMPVEVEKMNRLCRKLKTWPGHIYYNDVVTPPEGSFSDQEEEDGGSKRGTAA